jgi:surface polysaccharide O-acyltransferase-like enzyme
MEGRRMHQEAITVSSPGEIGRPGGARSSAVHGQLVAPAGRTNPTRLPSGRRSELDLLRALVVVGLVLFHTTVIFGAGEFPVKAATESGVATAFLAFGATWGMPLLFVISGMGIWHSLGSRGAGAFVRERVRRLLVPLLVGVLTLVPLQVYLGLRRSGRVGSFAGFYQHFLEVRPSLDFPFVVKAASGGGSFETGHLWFLVCLLGFSLALLPGFVLARRGAGMRVVERLGGLLARPGAVLLLGLPLAAVELPLGSEVGHAAWNRYSYALLLAYGYLAAADARIGEAFQRQWRTAMAGAVLLFAAAGPVFAAASAHADPFTGTDGLSLGFRLLKSVDGWLWVVAILGLARSRTARRRSRPARPAGDPSGDAAVAGRVGAYVNEAVLPFYVLHETVIVMVACFVLPWRIGVLAQILLISLVSLVVTLLVYDLGVRRSAITRWLFGLKPTRQPLARWTR